MYNAELVLNNLQLRKCHKIKPNQTKSCIFNVRGAFNKIPDFFLYRHLKLS